MDILHFDGHGVFDSDGHLQGEAKLGNERLFGSGSELARRAQGTEGANTGYLLFEDAELLGEMLHQYRVGLVVLSACQSAMVGGDEPMGSVAARLTATGIPSVLAMTHSVLVATTRELFGQFYGYLAAGQGVGAALDNSRRYLMRHTGKYEVQRGSERQMLHLDDWFLPALYAGGQ